uniref:ATP synthase complex subunit 8 n=1 Tax=Garra poecilura TaxID=643390 RepID=A0A1E1FMR8_9TELE|nr:ATP synthase F0 subunit 8 [Garra poecilura]BAV71800.1 ATPase subunit 8 [Garra poecilura]
MPQLNPNPWLMIFVLSWLTLLILTLTKIMNYTTPNEPTLMNTKKHKTEPWNWPW